MIATTTDRPSYGDAAAAPADQSPLPAYRSIKTVRALKILSIALHAGGTRAGAIITPADNGHAPFDVAQAWLDRHQPDVGGYIVQYEDGYRSYSPAAPFETGNIPERHWGTPRSQEPKYRINRRGRQENRVTGIEIPDEEPTFLFRAKDPMALSALQAYLAALHAAKADPLHIEAVQRRVIAFQAFSMDFPDRMRVPNSPLAVAATETSGAAA